MLTESLHSLKSIYFHAFMFIPSQSRYLPLPPLPHYPSTLKGGSWISTGHEASRFARFAFRRHFFQHAGFRLVRSAEPTPVRVCNVEVFVLGAGVSGKILYHNPVEAELKLLSPQNMDLHVVGLTLTL